MSDTNEALYASQQRAKEINAERAAESSRGRLAGWPGVGPVVCLQSDPVGEKLDELAELAQLWKAARQSGRQTDSIRAGLLDAIAAIQFLKSAKP
jgi:hypothetical protein